MIKIETSFGAWWLMVKSDLLQNEMIGLREIARAGWDAGRAAIPEEKHEYVFYGPQWDDLDTKVCTKKEAKEHAKKLANENSVSVMIFEFTDTMHSDEDTEEVGGVGHESSDE